jgi:RNA polymerase sigma-70 factor (ECF subfamily)
MVRTGCSEPELLAAARRGDLKAFECLVALHERRVYGLALRISGNAEDAKDALQETFLRLHRNLSRIDSELAIAPWLAQVAVNICRDMRRARRRSRLVAIDSVGPADSRPDPAAGPEQQAAARERERHLQAALRDLPETECAALVLREMQGLTTREVARALGSSETTVRSQISRARLRLRKIFAERLGGVR